MRGIAAFSIAVLPLRAGMRISSTPCDAYSATMESVASVDASDKIRICIRSCGYVCARSASIAPRICVSSLYAGTTAVTSGSAV
jgi:hypothetical protein